MVYGLANKRYFSFQLLARMMFSCLCLLIATQSASSSEQPSGITVTRLADYYFLSPNLEYYADTQRTYDFEQVRQSEFDPFWQRHEKQTPSFGYQFANFWLRTDISYQRLQASEWIIELPYPLLDLVELYLVRKKDGEISVTEMKTGDEEVFSRRPLAHRHFLFPLSMHPREELTLFLKINNKGSVQVPLHLWQREAFVDHDQQRTLVTGLYYGIMLIMVFYNLFICVITRSLSYLYYVFFVASFALYRFSYDGFAFQYLWPNFERLHYVSSVVFMCLAALTACLFAKRFLHLKEKIPVANHLLSAVAVICGISIFVALMGHTRPVAQMFVFLALCFVPTILYSGIRLSLQRDRAAIYFSVAWIMLLLGIILFALNKVGIFPRTFLTEFGIQVGSVIEVTLLSIALAARINDLRRREALAEHEAALAKSESKAKSEFLATMSHEIRTPMNGVLGMVDLMRDTRMDNQQQRYIDTIYSSGSALLTIINDILDYSKINAGQMDIESIDFELDTLIDECIGIFSLNAEQKNLDFAYRIDPEVPRFIAGDPLRLRQVLVNLLSNAFKFTERGRIQIAVELVEVNERKLLKFSVKDSGIGLSKDQQQKIFNSFEQASSDTSRKYGGTGLGLAICKQLTQLMGGDIGVDGEIGKGSTFWFTIMPATPSTSEEATSFLALKQALVGKKVGLYVPNQSGFMQLQCQLDRLGVQSSHVNLSYETLQEADINPLLAPYDAVIADLTAMGNIDLVRKFNKSAHWILLGNRTEVSQLQDLGLANLSVLEKPIVTRELVKTFVSLFSLDVFKSSEVKDEPSSFSELKVLVAEDNKTNQLVVRGMLNRLGVEPHLVVDGLEAIEYVERAYRLAQKGEGRCYDLVLMDCEMPRKNGYEATQDIRAQLKEWQDHPDLIIIALTAHTMQEPLQEAIDSGMDDYLIKPINYQDLTSKLAERFPRNTHTAVSTEPANS